MSVYGRFAEVGIPQKKPGEFAVAIAKAETLAAGNTTTTRRLTQFPGVPYRMPIKCVHVLLFLLLFLLLQMLNNVIHLTLGPSQSAKSSSSQVIHPELPTPGTYKRALTVGRSPCETDKTSRQE